MDVLRQRASAAKAAETPTTELQAGSGTMTEARAPARWVAQGLVCPMRRDDGIMRLFRPTGQTVS
ncbi:hypothetical protein NK6_6341 [Bradyrhizobium diazoefficiens]|uniref:Uncharacterized protein n=1 Tax=Bradyrhizobium diazoefficiens TaxID=1355477 RepID=A0A0E4BTA7_9BRAD|nr:hypothetical protein NK6_6341 [Bradyrhizobium diazoefficiens]